MPRTLFYFQLDARLHVQGETCLVSFTRRRGYYNNKKVPMLHRSDWLSWSWHPSRKCGKATSTVNATKKIKRPRYTTKLWSIQRLCNIFRRFLPNFALIEELLSNRSRQDQPTQFEISATVERNAMNELKTIWGHYLINSAQTYDIT